MTWTQADEYYFDSYYDDAFASEPQLPTDEVADRADEWELAVNARTRQLAVEEEARARHAARAATTRARPPIRTLTDFLAEPDIHAPWLVEGLLQKRANLLLAAQAKAGKSTLMGNLIRAVVDEVPFLGAYSSEPTTVTLIDDELDENMLRRWLREQGIANTDRVRLVSLRGQISTFDIINPATRAGWAEDIGSTGLLIFDCLRPALDSLGLSEDKDAGRFLVAFDELKREAGADCGAIVHHMGHDGERSRGDSRLLDWPDVSWTLTKEDSKDVRGRVFFGAYGRDVDVPPKLVEYDPVTRHLTLTGFSRSEVRTQDHLPKVLAVLSTTEGKSQNSIEKEVSGVGNNAIRAALETAFKQGLTVKVNGPRGAILHSLKPTSPNLAQTSPGELDVTSPTRLYERRGEVEDELNEVTSPGRAA